MHEKIDRLSGSTDELVDRIEQRNKEETAQSCLRKEPSLDETSENNLTDSKDKSEDVKGILLLNSFSKLPNINVLICK